MKVSIALAAFNGHKYLVEQLQSFADQTRLPDELVVVDDQSRDDTAEIVAAFAERAPFTVSLFVNEENVGPLKTFEKALRHCTGDIVFLSDQDDVWFTDKIQKMEALLSGNASALCVMNDAAFADVALVTSGVTKRQKIRSMGLPDTAFVMGCCAALRRDFLALALPIPDAARAHDNWLVGLSDALGRTYRRDEVLQYYRRHGRNVSNVPANNPALVGGFRRRLQKAVELLGRSGSGDVLAHELQFQSALLDRLETRRGEWNHVVEAAEVELAIASACARRDILVARAAIRSMPHPARVHAIAALMKRGGYRGISALSMLKDFLIARR